MSTHRQIRSSLFALGCGIGLLFPRISAGRSILLRSIRTRSCLVLYSSAHDDQTTYVTVSHSALSLSLSPDDWTCLHRTSIRLRGLLSILSPTVLHPFIAIRSCLLSCGSVTHQLSSFSFASGRTEACQERDVRLGQLARGVVCTRQMQVPFRHDTRKQYSVLCTNNKRRIRTRPSHGHPKSPL